MPLFLRIETEIHTQAYTIDTALRSLSQPFCLSRQLFAPLLSTTAIRGGLQDYLLLWSLWDTASACERSGLSRCVLWASLRYLASVGAVR
ncbi:hypothetical protein MHYP_G00076660 [Metynnis hypsauchen]